MRDLGDAGRAGPFPTWLASQDGDKFLPHGTNETNFAQLAACGAHFAPQTLSLTNLRQMVVDMGGDKSLFTTGDSLAKKPRPAQRVLTNPPFGRKSSIQAIGAGGKIEKEMVHAERATFGHHRNKQLNFVQPG